MIRKTHLLRLRIAREQFPASPRLGRWLARFFTYRNALSYARRFAERPAPLKPRPPARPHPVCPLAERLGLGRDAAARLIPRASRPPAPNRPPPPPHRLRLPRITLPSP
jgi:hypothetical protein